MLFINYNAPAVGGVRNSRNIQWHVGDSLPTFPKGVRVVSFQADGHELEALLKGLQAAMVLPDSSVAIVTDAMERVAVKVEHQMALNVSRGSLAAPENE